MRFSTAISRFVVACLLVSALPAFAADPPPIPYDAKKAEALRDRYRLWYRATTIAPYMTIGNRSPKWDDLVTGALRANVERMAGPALLQADATVEFREKLELAIKAGCDDPLIVYYHVRMQRRDTNATVKKEFFDAARSLAGSKYPDIRKGQAWLNAMPILHFAPKGQKASDDDLKQAVECRDELLKLLVGLTKQKDPNLRREAIELCDVVSRNGHDVGKRKEWFDRLETEVLSKLPEGDSLPDLIAGLFLVNYAWDARGDGFAGTVTADGSHLFEERLEEAERRLIKAWELDKTNSQAAARLLYVCIGLGRDRDVMEEWFRKALEANPNETSAYIGKIDFIHPKWHGSTEELLEFGRQMAKSPNWADKVPMYLPKVHNDLASHTSDFIGYFRKNPEIWKEIEPVMEEMRKLYPKSRYGASWYVYYSWLCERNPMEALAYSQAVDHDLILEPFGTQATLNRGLAWVKKKAALAEKK